MGRPNGFSDWFMKFAMFVAMMTVFGLPAIYWAGKKFLGVDAKKSVESLFGRMFSHSSSSSSGSSDGAADRGDD